MKKKFKELWRGEIPMVDTFWIYNIGFYVIFTLFLVTLSAFEDYLRSINNNKTIYIMGLSMFFILCSYMTVALVGLWRSSNSYNGHVEWRVIAKLYVMYTAYNMFQGFFKTLVELRTLLN